MDQSALALLRHFDLWRHPPPCPLPQQPDFLRKLSALKASADAGCHNCQTVHEAVLSFPCFACLPMHDVLVWFLFPTKLYVFEPMHAVEAAKARHWELDFFTADEYSASCYPKLEFRLDGHLGPYGDTSSNQSLQHALNWIRECRRSHRSCGQGSVQRLPTRVLDVSGSVVRLFHGNGESARYACLSHCWGDQQFILRTTTANLDEFCEHIPTHLIPKTFSDAISFTRSLGLHYLWVDSLCIIQDDQSIPSDWQKESAKMASVYRNAYVTIAAASEAGPSAGCFTTTEEKSQARPYVLQSAKAISPIGTTLYARLQRPHVAIGGDRSRFPILQRAWIFQERLLSPRILYFGGDELQWQCREAYHCECGKSVTGDQDKLIFARQTIERTSHSDSKETGCLHDLAPSNELGLSLPSLDHSFPIAWRKLLVHYTKLHLTYESDVLPALSGIAKTWSRKHGDQYYAGLWKSTLVHDLLWYTVLDTSRRASRERCAPSWSWASVDFTWPCTYEHRNLSDRNQDSYVVKDVKITEMVCKPVGADAFGQLRSGYLKLSCRAIVGMVHPPDGAKGNRLHSHSVTFHKEGCMLDVRHHNTTRWTENGLSVYVLPLVVKHISKRWTSIESSTTAEIDDNPLECLLVRQQPSDEGDADQGTYERSGYAYLSASTVVNDARFNGTTQSDEEDETDEEEDEGSVEAYHEFARKVAEAPIRTFTIV
ncbi:HET-domain-containing protein [Lophiostoma macrostomum CBS 122681]|uniref:HET-domain-containing protein n=1 Tax=Lophiostoma macrostomum CBS 122681 TaxID=1314788 RepID=A0A6A6SLD1_9PLEO|nr:HET-domain-containing protein [Lophiostoma macrostomum CBS 122681]